MFRSVFEGQFHRIAESRFSSVSNLNTNPEQFHHIVLALSLHSQFFVVESSLNLNC